MSELIEGLEEDQEIPEGWERLDYLCYRDRGSKAYKHEDGTVIHVVDLHDTHEYRVLVVESEDEDMTEDVSTYRGAIEKAVELMKGIGGD